MTIDRRQLSKALLAGFAMGAASALRAQGDAYSATTVACTVVMDQETGTIIKREGPCEHQFSPCSSFKLAIAAMGFDAGILVDPHHPRFDYRPEYEAQADRDKKSVDPMIWLADSVVWYSQQATMRLGMMQFQRYVDQFDYGNRDLAGDPGEHDGLTHAWLMTSLAISPDQQVSFIKRLLDRKLGISGHAYAMVEATVPVYSGNGGWKIHGKSGSGWLRSTSGAYDMSRPQGWFVGWADNVSKRVIFARLRIGAAAAEVPGGTTARAEVLEQLAAWVS